MSNHTVPSTTPEPPDVPRVGPTPHMCVTGTGTVVCHITHTRAWSA